LCASGEPIVLHDPDLQRVAGANVVAARASLLELRRFDLGAGERIPTLEQALDLVIGNGHLLNVELKDDVPDPHALVLAVAQCLAARPAGERERMLFSSFGLELCRALHAAMPEAQIALLFARERQEPPPFAVAVHPQHALADAASIAGWHARGLVVNAWTVNDGETACALVGAGIDGIVTDDVPLIRTALASPLGV
jgi:glycerophosphoryl diester phosphodiesterase